MQVLPSIGQQIREGARTAENGPGREDRREDPVEMEQNNLEEVHTPSHRRNLELMHPKSRRKTAIFEIM